MLLTILPTLLLCKVTKLQQSVWSSRELSVKFSAMSKPNASLSPQPPTVVVESSILFFTEKSQAHVGNVCSLHFLATSRAIPALIRESRKAVSRVPAK